jgi:hypothetical protein
LIRNSLLSALDIPPILVRWSHTIHGREFLLHCGIGERAPPSFAH